MIEVILAVTTAFFLATTFLAVHQKMKAEEARDEAVKAATAAHLRLNHARSTVAPLAWSWDIVEAGSLDGLLPVAVTRLRHFLVSAFSSIQQAADMDDLAMAETMERVPEPPRRLPRYPQVPPYLASPEDVANIPPMPEAGQ